MRTARSRPIAATALVLGTTLVWASACGSARRSEPLTGAADPPTAELLLGQQVFDLNCSQCHPGGEGGLAYAINNKPLPRWLMRFQVRTGAGAMPAFPERDISDEELDAMLDYLVWLRSLPTGR